MPIARGEVAMATSALISRRWGWVIVGMTLGLPLTGSRFAPAQVLSDIARLIAQLRDESLTVRGNAADALGGIGPAAVPALVAALKDDNANVRGWAARALGGIGPAAKDAIPSLTVSLKDRDAEVRGWAAKALRAISPPAVPTSTP